MDELRLSLLALFVALIAGIYIRGSLRRRRMQLNDAVEPQAAVVADEQSADGDERNLQFTATSGFDPDPVARAFPDDYLSGEENLSISQEAGGSDVRTDEPQLSEWRQDALLGGDSTGSSNDGLSDLPPDMSSRISLEGDIPFGNIDLLDATPDGTPFQQQQLDLYGNATGVSASAAAKLTKRQAAKRRSAEPAATGNDDSLIIVLHVMQPDRRNFDGRRVHAALKRAELEFGDMNIFHHFGLGHAANPVFSVAKAVEPGTFDASDDESFETPGLTFFMRLPGPEDGSVVLELMFAAAKGIARELDGYVVDETRSTLSAQVLNHLRDRVIEFSRIQRLSLP